MSKKQQTNIAIFASGEGTNADAVMTAFEGNVKARVALVVTNKASAGVIKRAERHKVDWLLIEKQDFADREMVGAIMDEYAIDWIVLAGWLLLVPHYLIARYPQKIVNIHPSLLPKFGGKGMYGKRVHQAVFEAGERQSGITIHYVNEYFDKGKIIAQFAVSIAGDDAHTIEKKVRDLELKHYSEAIKKLVL